MLKVPRYWHKGLLSCLGKTDLCNAENVGRSRRNRKAKEAVAETVIIKKVITSIRMIIHIPMTILLPPVAPPLPILRSKSSSSSRRVKAVEGPTTEQVEMGMERMLKFSNNSNKEKRIKASRINKTIRQSRKRAIVPLMMTIMKRHVLTMIMTISLMLMTMIMSLPTRTTIKTKIKTNKKEKDRINRTKVVAAAVGRAVKGRSSLL